MLGRINSGYVWMMAGNLSAMLVPIMVLPYLSRVLGQESLGEYFLVNSLIGVAFILVDFSFDTVGTRTVSGFRDDLERASYFYRVQQVKLLLAVISAVMVSFLVWLSGKVTIGWGIVGGVSLNVIGRGLSCQWYLIAEGKSIWAGAALLFGKMVFLALCYLLIVNSSQVWLVIFLNGISMMISGALTFLYIRYKLLPNVYVCLNIKEAINTLRSGGSIFSASLLGNVYGQGSSILVGFMCPIAVVGEYGIWEKLYKATGGFLSPVAQMMIPRAVALAGESDNDLRKVVILRFVYFGLLSSGIILISGLFLGNFVFSLVSGRPPSGTISMGIPFLAAVCLTTMNVILHPFVVVLVKDKFVMKLYAWASVIFLITAPILTHLFSGLGMALSLVIVEFFILIAYVHNLKICKGRKL